MASPKKEPKLATSKTIWGVGATICTVIPAVIALHSYFFVPLMLQEARKSWEVDIRRAIDRHEDHPHQGAVTEEVFQLSLRPLVREVEKLSKNNEALTKLLLERGRD